MKATCAELFQNGGSQAVRLPKECRFAAEREVLVRREGRRVILEAADEWSDRFRTCLDWAMISLVDLRAARERSSDHLELRAYLQQVVGQPFLLMRFSYGDELTLHFGQPRQYRSSRLGHLTKGSYIIGARASSWFLRTHLPPTVVIGTSQPVSLASKHLKPLTPEQAEASELLTPGTRMVAVDAITLGTGTRSTYGFGLSALLEDGASLLILPPAMLKGSHRQHQVADWEVFTPYERYFTVGPGLRWSYLPSRASTRASA